MTPRLVLSLFPGIGLLDRAFEEAGFCVVRGPDAMWGGDVRRFHAPPGVFDGVIGGPPCQVFSSAAKIRRNTRAVDLIPEFVRIIGEAQPRWSVMENVDGVLRRAGLPSGWHPARLRDWDCGGLTSRRRSFWTFPCLVFDSVPRPGRPERIVMASTARRGDTTTNGDSSFLRGDLPLEDYEKLQGVPGHTEAMRRAGASRGFAIHLLGNGVPLAMGRTIAAAVLRSMYAEQARAA